MEHVYDRTITPDTLVDMHKIQFHVAFQPYHDAPQTFTSSGRPQVPAYLKLHKARGEMFPCFVPSTRRKRSRTLSATMRIQPLGDFSLRWSLARVSDLSEETPAASRSYSATRDATMSRNHAQCAMPKSERKSEAPITTMPSSLLRRLRHPLPYGSPAQLNSLGSQWSSSGALGLRSQRRASRRCHHRRLTMYWV